MTKNIKPEPLSVKAFRPYGNVLETTGTPDKMINRGRCARFHDLADLDFQEGQAGISLFMGKKETLPLRLEMVERHPLGSQAFIPMTPEPFLIVVASNANGTPVDPRAFISKPGQAINFHRGIWHGVLTPLSEPGLFAVVDRIGDGANLEEYWFQDSYLVT